MHFSIGVVVHFSISIYISSGGMETVIMNYYKNIDRSKIQFDFLVRLPESSSDFYNDEILKLGGRIYRIPYTSIWDKILYPIRIFLFVLFFINHIFALGNYEKGLSD